MCAVLWGGQARPDEQWRCLFARTVLRMPGRREESRTLVAVWRLETTTAATADEGLDGWLARAEGNRCSERKPKFLCLPSGERDGPGSGSRVGRTYMRRTTSDGVLGLVRSSKRHCQRGGREDQDGAGLGMYGHAVEQPGSDDRHAA